MGTIIEAAGTATGGGMSSVGAMALADAAARSCLERANRTADEVDLLINAGVYLDRSISEPAIAALIQEDIAANPEYKVGEGHGTFSFDVRNGASGLLTGMQLVDGMLASGTVKLGIVVAADADPDPGVSEGYGFPPVGGAVLLSADESRPGFTAFRLATFPELADQLVSSVEWRQDGQRGATDQGRNVLTVEIADSYGDRALDCAEATADELVDANGLDFGEVGLLVATASVPGFGQILARRLGVSSERLAPLPDGLQGAHTAAPAVALATTELGAGTTALFISVGAGITVAAAIYQT